MVFIRQIALNVQENCTAGVIALDNCRNGNPDFRERLWST